MSLVVVFCIWKLFGYSNPLDPLFTILFSTVQHKVGQDVYNIMCFYFEGRR